MFQAMQPHGHANGYVIDGPNLVLCHRHRHWVDGLHLLRRYRVVHGWLGAANQHGYGHTVYQSRAGGKAASWWWQRSQKRKWGEPSRRDAA